MNRIAGKGQHRKRLAAILCALLTMAFALSAAGCGAGDPKVDAKDLSRSTALFLKDNSIEVISVEGFAQNYYSEKELENQVKAWVGEFNRSGERVQLKSIEVDKNIARMDLVYKNSEAYEDLNGTAAYYGTMAGAGQKGYDTNLFIGTVSVQNTNKFLTASAATDMDDVKVIILSQPIAVCTADKIRYVSTNVTLTGEKEAVASEDTSEQHPAVLILE